jgi:hypothetical protein
VAFDLSLKAVVQAPRPAWAQFTFIGANNDGSINLRIAAPANTQWRVECASAADGSAVWQSVQSVTTDTSGAASLIDTGDKSRASPRSTATRFYRLVEEVGN